MSTVNNNPPPAQLFTNNKSLYGSRAYVNQSSKKISIIEDKTTLEPVRHSNTPNSFKSSSNANIHRSISTPVSLPQPPTLSQIRKQIDIQKHALNSYPLESVQDGILQQLEDWKTSMYARVHESEHQCANQNDDQYRQIVEFLKTAKITLQESIISKLLQMKQNPNAVHISEIDKLEDQLDKIQVNF